MKRILTEIIILCTWFLPLSMGTAATPLQAVAFPAAAYRNERATFILAGTPGTPLEVTLNDQSLLRTVFQTNRLEANLCLSASGALQFQHATTTLVFAVVQPGDQAVLREWDGYLYAAERPAVLLTEHPAPPKHDRRWETVKLACGLFSDTRPVVASGLLVSAGLLRGVTPDTVGKLTGVAGKFWTAGGTTDCFYELNGLITGVAALPPAEAAVILLSAADQERGLDDLQFEIKLHWYLQAVKRGVYQQIFIVPPPLDAEQSARFPDLAGQVKLVARGNAVRYANVNYRNIPQPLSIPSWLQTVLKEMQKDVKCKSGD